MILGPQKKIKIHRNSSFSAIVGCKDIMGNVWQYRRNQCFSCNNLTTRPNYADSKQSWSTYYKAGCVFPLRYEVLSQNAKGSVREYRIMGFLTFDSRFTDIFGEIPSRFDYMDDPDGYLEEFRTTDVYHVGMSIAEVIAIVAKLTGLLAEKDMIRSR